MKKLCLLICLLAFASGVMAQLPAPRVGDDFEKQSAATARDFPDVTLEISLKQPSFQIGEPIVVTFTYRNETATAVNFTQSGTSYSPMRVVKREFRARQLDGDALLQTQTLRIGIISELVGFKTIEPHQSVNETVFLNERFFLERAGRYELTAWSNAVSLNGKRQWLQSIPIELQIVPATEAFQSQVLNETKTQIEAALKIARGRLLSSYPHQLGVASFAAKRLEWLHDERAIPILVAALEIGNNYQYNAERALLSYPREKVRDAMQRRLAEPEPIISGRDIWLKLGADSPEGKAQLEAQFNNSFRAALNAATNRLQRGTLATRGLMDSPTLRREPKFWHESLTNLGGGNVGFNFYSLLSVPSDERKTRAAQYPITTADLKTALESAKPFQARMIFFHALKERDPAYLRQFLLARVDNMSFDYPRGAFDVFSDDQMKSVAAKLVAAIQDPAIGSDIARRDGFGRRLRDLALRGTSIEQLETVENWLLQNAPAADAPILDAIALKKPLRTWFWLQKSLTKRPLESPYDNRMRALVLQKNADARAVVRDLLQNGSPQRRVEVLNAIASAATKPLQKESQSRWSSGEQLFPRASAATFTDLQNDLKNLATGESDTVQQAAAKALSAIVDLNKSTNLSE